ncbi:MAG: SBBP repeat-containing protein, partial [candidate division WOR-3 bacterium]
MNPNFSEVPYAITVDSFGNSYTTGYVGLGNNGGVGIIKLDNQGNEKWFYWNDLGTAIIGHSIKVYNDKVYVGGYMDSLGYERIVVISIDTLGNERWIYKDTLYNSEGYAIMISQSHHIYVAGIKYPSPPDWVVLKLDSLGNLCWRYVYDGPAGSYDEASSIVIDGNENIYVGGYSTGLGTAEDFTVIKLDSAGQEQWVYRYDGPASYRDELKALTIDSSGSVYGAGGSWSGIGSWDFLVVKLDSNGNERWVYRFDGYAHYYDWAEDVVVDDSGFVYACGLSYLYNNTLQYFAVIVLDSGGVEFWRYLTAGPLGYGGYPRRMVLDGLGYIYACGNLDGYLAVVKLSGLGNEEWVYKDTYAMIARGIVADVAGNIYVAGQRRVSQWNDDIVVMKFAALQGEVKEVVG